MAVERLDRLVDHIQAQMAVDRDAAPGLQQAGEGPDEDAVLAEPARIQAQDELNGDEDHEVPVRGVVGADHHELVQRRHLPFDAPAHQFQHATPQPLREWIGR
ncbi:hypothetical protein D3C78_1681530 [compost metagenome]